MPFARRLPKGTEDSLRIDSKLLCRSRWIGRGEKAKPAVRLNNHFRDMHGQKHFTQYACPNGRPS
jgi:hypothetical protein